METTLKPQSASLGKKPDDKEIKMIVEDGILKVKDLPAIMKEFRKPLPTEALQESKAADTKKGYDTLGYGYAWITERLNDVVGFCWRVIETDEPIKEHKTSSGNTMFEISSNVILQLGNWKNKEVEESIKTEMPLNEPGQFYLVQKSFKIVRDFEVLAESPVGNGWHRAFSLADARKGARTNGLKKAAGFFGIGNEAYKKSIDEENQAVKESLAKKRSRKSPSASTAAQPSQANLALVNQKLEMLGAKTDEEKLIMLRDRFKFTAMNLKTLNDKQLKMILAKILQAQQAQINS